MKTNNAIKKLEKTGFTVTISAGFVIARRGKSKITFIDQDGDVIALGDGDMRYDNLTQAIALS
jgi:hypothetical protein